STRIPRLVRVRCHPLSNALHRHFFARNEIALDEGTADRTKRVAVVRVVVDAQRRAILEDDAPRAFNLKGEQIEWILKPADLKFLARPRRSQSRHGRGTVRVDFARYGGRSVFSCLEMLSSRSGNRLRPSRVCVGKAERRIRDEEGANL